MKCVHSLSAAFSAAFLAPAMNAHCGCVTWRSEVRREREGEMEGGGGRRERGAREGTCNMFPPCYTTLPGSSVPRQAGLVVSNMPQEAVQFLQYYLQWDVLITAPLVKKTVPIPVLIADPAAAPVHHMQLLQIHTPHSTEDL